MFAWARSLGLFQIPASLRRRERLSIMRERFGDPACGPANITRRQKPDVGSIVLRCPQGHREAFSASPISLQSLATAQCRVKSLDSD